MNVKMSMYVNGRAILTYGFITGKPNLLVWCHKYCRLNS